MGALQSCYEWSPLVVCRDSASAVEQISVTDYLVVLAPGVQSSGTEAAVCGYQPSDLGWGSFVDWEAQQRAQKRDTSLFGAGW